MDADSRQWIYSGPCDRATPSLGEGAASSAATLALWMACQTLFDVNGTSREVTPRGTSASITALAIAAGAATVPASPAPFTPRMLSGLGVSVRVSSKGGSSLARGTA